MLDLILDSNYKAIENFICTKRQKNMKVKNFLIDFSCKKLLEFLLEMQFIHLKGGKGGESLKRIVVCHYQTYD